jgi:hypothetical protein
MLSSTIKNIPSADQLSRELASIPEVVLEILGGMGSSIIDGNGLIGYWILRAELDTGVSRPSGILRLSVSSTL